MRLPKLCWRTTLRPSGEPVKAALRPSHGTPAQRRAALDPQPRIGRNEPIYSVEHMPEGDAQAPDGTVSSASVGAALPDYRRDATGAPR